MELEVGGDLGDVVIELRVLGCCQVLSLDPIHGLLVAQVRGALRSDMASRASGPMVLLLVSSGLR